MKLSRSLEQNKGMIRRRCSQSADVLLNDLMVGAHRCTVCWCDGMVDNLQCHELVFRQLHAAGHFLRAQGLFNDLLRGRGKLYDAKQTDELEQLVGWLMSGHAVVLIDGVAGALAVSAQGYACRAISESYTEENVRSSREGFVESIKVNITMIRRRIKSGRLVFEGMTAGSVSKTEIAVVYLKNRVSPKLVEAVKKRLRETKLELVLESGYLQPFLEPRKLSLFATTGHTERPDTLCAKLLEGRVGVLVDGTPFALILPYLFTESFQCFDDYTNKPYYASMVRVLKYLAFLVSFLLPGLYVAVVSFSPELLPSGLLVNIAQAQQNTALPLMLEALFIHFVYEVVREAGLRLPRPVGHAVSLIGALVIGDAAISAGIIAAPMVMAVAFTALCSFTIPLLYEPVTVLRLAFILIGGTLGLVGVAFALVVVLLNICAVNSYGVPYMSPITPYSRPLFTDGFIRKSWVYHAGRSKNLYHLNGAQQSDE